MNDDVNRPDGLQFPKSAKLRRSVDYATVYAGQCRAGDGFLLVFALRNRLGVTRCGLSVSRKHGNAVRRNRLKRILREVFRLTRHDLPRGLDLILIPRHNAQATFHDYRNSLPRLVRRLDRRLRDCPDNSASATVRRDNRKHSTREKPGRQ